MPFYDTQDYNRSVDGMKIIPLQTSEIKRIVNDGKKYCELYQIFKVAYDSELPPHNWYEESIVQKV